jgi:hypothetical protein
LKVAHENCRDHGVLRVVRRPPVRQMRISELTTWLGHRLQLAIL